LCPGRTLALQQALLLDKCCRDARVAQLPAGPGACAVNALISYPRDGARGLVGNYRFDEAVEARAICAALAPESIAPVKPPPPANEEAR
jgi:hypothetical protein